MQLRFFKVKTLLNNAFNVMHRKLHVALQIMTRRHTRVKGKSPHAIKHIRHIQQSMLQP